MVTLAACDALGNRYGTDTVCADLSASMSPVTT